MQQQDEGLNVQQMWVRKHRANARVENLDRATGQVRADGLGGTPRTLLVMRIATLAKYQQMIAAIVERGIKPLGDAATIRPASTALIIA